MTKPAPARTRPRRESLADDLDAQQYAAIELLSAGVPVGKVAEDLGVHRASLRRWRLIPAFAQELDRRRREAARDVAAQYPPLVSTSLAVLADLLTDPDPRVRHAAASTVLRSADLPALIAAADAPEPVDLAYRGDVPRFVQDLRARFALDHPEGT